MNIAAETATNPRATSSTDPTTTPVVSVVMLAYNHGPFIRESIESILGQKTTFPIELIIGEDCSPDNTREIALEFQRKHPGVVRVLTSEKNVGALENLRRCEQACRGNYVSFCEGDDYWHVPQKLQQQVDFLETHPDYVMTHTDFRIYFIESGKMVPKGFGVGGGLDDSDAFNEILSGQRLVLTLTVCARRSTLDEILRDCPECYSSRFLMGDTQRWLELARCGKIKYMPEVLATRRVLVESATQSKNPERVLRFAYSAKDVLEHYAGKYGCSPEARKAMTSRSADHIIKCAFEARNHDAARKALEDYRKVDASIPLEGYLYYFGSRSFAIRPAVRLVVEAINLSRKVSRRMTRLLKPA